MLDIGPTKLWELINAGEVESYLDGPRRKIIIASIRQYVERRRGKPAPERKGVRARRDQVSAKF